MMKLFALSSCARRSGQQQLQEPAINLDTLGFGFNSFNEFLTLARIFADVGVSVYLGAAPLIQNKDYLDAAARIVTVQVPLLARLQKGGDGLTAAVTHDSFTEIVERITPL
jgi:Ferritin-like domain